MRGWGGELGGQEGQRRAKGVGVLGAGGALGGDGRDHQLEGEDVEDRDVGAEKWVPGTDEGGRGRGLAGP